MQRESCGNLILLLSELRQYWYYMAMACSLPHNRGDLLWMWVPVLSKSHLLSLFCAVSVRRSGGGSETHVYHSKGYDAKGSCQLAYKTDLGKHPFQHIGSTIIKMLLWARNCAGLCGEQNEGENVIAILLDSVWDFVQSELPKEPVAAKWELDCAGTSSLWDALLAGILYNKIMKMWNNHEGRSQLQTVFLKHVITQIVECTHWDCLGQR